MKKKMIVLTLMSIFLISVFAGAVRAQEDKGMFDKPFELLVSAFGGLAKASQGEYGLKLLFGLVIFVLLFGGSEFVLKRYARGVRLAITLLIGIIASISIPGEAITILSTVWGGFFYMLFALFPIVGVMYLAMYSFKGTERSDYLIKSIFSAVGLFLSVAWGGSSFITKYAGTSTPVNIWNVFDSIFGIVTLVALIMTIYYLFKLAIPEQKAGVNIPEGVQKSLKRWWRSRGRGDFTREPPILRDIKQGIKKKEKWKDLEKKFRKSDQILKRTANLITWSYHEVNKIRDSTARGEADTKITEMQAEIDKVEDGLTKVEIALKATTPDYNSALSEINIVITAHNALMKLELEFMDVVGIPK